VFLLSVPLYPYPIISIHTHSSPGSTTRIWAWVRCPSAGQGCPVNYSAPSWATTSITVTVSSRGIRASVNLFHDPLDESFCERSSIPATVGNCSCSIGQYRFRQVASVRL
jgi:hypothetical protein